MLPAHIIHDILEQEKKRDDQILEDLLIELPDHVVSDNLSTMVKDDKPTSDRGVAIIDYFG